MDFKSQVPDFDDQAGFDLELFCIGQAKVCKHVAATTMHFYAFDQSSFHVCKQSQRPTLLRLFGFRLTDRDADLAP